MKRELRSYGHIYAAAHACLRWAVRVRLELSTAHQHCSPHFGWASMAAAPVQPGVLVSTLNRTQPDVMRDVRPLQRRSVGVGPAHALPN